MRRQLSVLVRWHYDFFVICAQSGIIDVPHAHCCRCDEIRMGIIGTAAPVELLNVMRIAIVGIIHFSFFF